MAEQVERIPTTGTGSATPSPSPSTKTTRWEQLDPSLRGSTKLEQPTTVAPKPTLSEEADAAPKVRSMELPEGAPRAPRINFGKQNLGFTKTEIHGFPWSIRNTPNWRIGSGTGMPSKFASGFLNYGAALGQPNPKSQFVDPTTGKFSGRAALGLSGILALTAIVQASKGNIINEQTGTTLDEDIAAAYEQMGFPKDISLQMAKDANLSANVLNAVTGVGAAAVADTAAGAVGAGVGAAVGSVVPGVGTAAGAGIGWAAATTISGVSSLVNMFIEAPFGIDVPTVDDLWGFKDIYGAAGELSWSTAQDLIMNSAALAHPTRIRPFSDVLVMQNKVIDGTYATGKEGDPRGQEMADLVAQGYFIKKRADGTEGIDVYAYQKYQIDTMMYLQQSDKDKYLPAKTGTPREIDQTMWINLWRNAE